MSSVSIKNLDLSFGTTQVLQNLNIEIADGEFLVLLGASGCGKSTLLNCIAGLLDASAGQIFIKGKNVTWEEPSNRAIGMVFQSYALYPQMTVLGNLSFGLKNAGVPKNEIHERVSKAAEILQIESLLKRKPAALSGGQRQRVAIGRALVRDVDVFLFDEPLSNLDAKLRTDLRVEIKRLHQRLENTMIYVTHDQVEAMTLADRIAIMKGGSILQLDNPTNIYNCPANKYVASFVGSPSMNFLEGKLDLNQMAIECAGLNISLKGYQTQKDPNPSSTAWLGVRPEHIVVGEQAKQLPFSAEVVVEIVEPLGSDTLVWSTLAQQPFHFRLDGQEKIQTKDKIIIGFDPTRASLFNADTEERI